MAKGSKEAKVLFTAEVSQFTQGITQINKSLSNLKSDLKACNADLKANGNSYETLSNKQQTLRKVIDQLTDKLEAQEKCLQSAKEILGEGSEQYNRYYRAINNTKAELTKFQRELQDTEQALDGLNDEMKSADEGTLGLNGSLDDMVGGMKGSAVATVALGGILSNLASSAISFCVDKLSEFAQYLWDLPEATEEFRLQMAKLNGATTQYGYDVELTKEKVKEMYGYFNDEQMAVNAITNLQGLGLSQTELNATLDAGVAVWTAYGDSIPIESLTESINETAQVGKVTGSLADALNWAGISEEEFNKELEKTKDTQKRAKKITDTLNKAYSKSKKEFDDNTESIRDYREELYETTESSSEVAESIEEVKTVLEDLKGKTLKKLAPTIEKVCDAFLDFVDACKNVKKEVDKIKQSPTWQYLSIVANTFIQPLIAKFKILWEVIKTVWSVCEVLWEGLKSLANMLSTVLLKCKPLQDALQWLSDRFKRASSDASPLISKLEDLQSKLQTVKEWIKKVSEKWSFSNPSLPSGLQNFINKAKGVYDWFGKLKTKWSFSNPSLPSGLQNFINKAKSVKEWIDKIAKKFTLTFDFKVPKLTTKSMTIMGQTFKYPAVSWNAVGGIFTKPTILNTRAGLQGVGEAGAEAILPLDSFYKHLDDKLESMNTGGDVYITGNQFTVNSDLDIEKVAEQLAYQIKRKSRF